MMNEMMMALGTEVIKRLYNSDHTILTEDDIRAHMPIDLTRASGIEIVGFLAQLRLCASVEMSVNQETGETLAIVVLVARTRKVHRRERTRLEQEFVARLTMMRLNRSSEVI